MKWFAEVMGFFTAQGHNTCSEYIYSTPDDVLFFVWGFGESQRVSVIRIQNYSVA